MSKDLRDKIVIEFYFISIKNSKLLSVMFSIELGWDMPLVVMRYWLDVNTLFLVYLI